MSPLFYKYDAGAVILPSDLVRSKYRAEPLFASAFESNLFRIKDGGYLGLRPDMLERFLREKVWTTTLRFEPDAFDCDDFAAVARGEVLKAARDHQLEGVDIATGKRVRKNVFVAENCHYQSPSGTYHDALSLMDSLGRIWHFEPQTGLFTMDLAKHIREGCEVWG
jgi:hypothetical protein